jgi:hypothetical protein
MKQVSTFTISISCLIIILLSSSCKKDPLNTVPPSCDTCNTNVLNSTFLNVSNWIKQDDGSYTSDITQDLKQAGISVSKIYAMDIAEGAPFLQIFPVTRAYFCSGYISVTVNLSKDEGTCILTYGFSIEEHDGEVRPGGLLPFGSVEIEVCFLN